MAIIGKILNSRSTIAVTDVDWPRLPHAQQCLHWRATAVSVELEGSG